MTQFPINTPLGLGDLLDRVFRLYRLHVSKMVLAVAIFVVPMGILSAILTQNTTASSFAVLREIFETGTPAVQQNEPSVWSFLLIPLGFVVQGFVGLISAQMAIDALHGRLLSVADALRTAASKFFPWMGMTILMGVGMMLVGVVVFIVGMILFFIFAFVFGALAALFVGGGPPLAGPDMNISMTIGIGLIVFLLYIGVILLFASPFLYFYGRWSVSLPVLLVESEGPAGALGRSWNLTQASGRRAMGYVFFAYLLSFVILGTPSTVLQFVIGLSMPIESQWIALALISGINVIINVLISPISSIAYVLFYYELRVRKESYDLAMQLAPTYDAIPVESAV